MNYTKQIAKHLRGVYFGGNWADSNLKDNLADINWEQATTKIYDLNTIAALVYHINYYVSAVSKVFEGEALNAKDKLSFDHPPFHSQEDWDQFLEQVWADGEKFASLIEQVPDSLLGDIFIDEKYGTYYSNLNGIIEHLYYHLGQIKIIKKILLQSDEKVHGS